MEWMGNIFTHYNNTTTDIKQTKTRDLKEISSVKSDFAIRIDTTEVEVALPQNSPFSDWKEARRFAGPLPFTFTYNEDKNEVLTIEGVRQNWIPRPVKVLEHNFSFFDSLGISNPVLANAFIVENIPYYWKKGKKEIWKK